MQDHVTEHKTCSSSMFGCKARARTINSVDVVTGAASTVNLLAQLMPPSSQESKRARTVAYLSETLAVSAGLSRFERMQHGAGVLSGTCAIPARYPCGSVEVVNR